LAFDELSMNGTLGYNNGLSQLLSNQQAYFNQANQQFNHIQHSAPAPTTNPDDRLLVLLTEV
jgi:hypothetical protein